MSLLDDLASTKNGPVGSRCTVGLMLEGLSDEEAVAVRQAFAGPLRSSTLGKLLRSNGHDISDDTVQRHRRGACRCLTS